MVKNRPSLTAELKREVRKRCGFGCVICGRPIYDYDHILGWASVKRHLASEITLLCDNHHREKTAGFINNRQVIEADKNPFNICNGVTAPYTLHYGGGVFSLKVGGFDFDGTSSCEAIRIDGETLLKVRLEDDHFLLSLTVYDSNDHLVLLIDDNELILNAHLWDIEVVGSRVIVREGQGIILFDVLFRPPSSVVIMRGRFLYNQIELLVAPGWCAVLNNRILLTGITVSDFSIGLDLGDNPLSSGEPAAFHLGGIPRRDWDRNASIRWARDEAATSLKVMTAIDELLGTL